MRKISFFDFGLPATPVDGKVFLRPIRIFLAVGFFVFYACLALHPPAQAPAPAFAGIELRFLPHLEFLSTPLCARVVSVVGILYAALFAWGWGVPAWGFGLLLVHFIFHGPAVFFGWEPLVDPLLLCLIAATYRPKDSAKVILAIRIGVTLALGWIGWSQMRAAPWLHPEVVARYAAHSPFALIFQVFRGFIPLVEIFGGFAWLLQLTAPAALWIRPLRAYWVVLLIASQGLLEIFMPAPFWNLAVVAGVVSFVPEDWLRWGFRDWKKNEPGIRLAWRKVGLVTVMAIMLSTIFERNIAQQFDIFAKIGSAPVERAYRVVTSPFVKAGNLILFNSIWKMYSPTWRHVVWIEWYAKNRDGTTTWWPQENFSPDYRMNRRTWAEALWTDFKKEKVFVGMLSGVAEKAAYGRYLCYVISRETGVRPLSVHAEISSFNIRGPEEAWSLREQKAERVEPVPEVPCGE